MKARAAQVLVVSVLWVVSGGGWAWADAFADHDATVLASAASSKLARALPEVNLAKLAQAPSPFKEHPGCVFLVVRTNDGDWSKLLVRLARRKANSGKPIDLLLVERLATFSGDPRRGVIVDRKEMLLFPGLALDADAGQIVPADQGADLALSLAPNGGGSVLKAVNGATLYAVVGSLAPAAAAAPARPAAGFGDAGLKPAEFSGEYQLDADGRWTGKLILNADDNGVVSGEFQSDSNGKSYPVSGTIGDPVHHIEFQIRFPMTEQRFDGYLWTRSRDRIAGITHMEGRPFGFIANRSR